MYSLGSKNTIALMQESSESSILTSFMANTNSSIILAPILEMSKLGEHLGSNREMLG